MVSLFYLGLLVGFGFWFSGCDLLLVSMFVRLLVRLFAVGWFWCWRFIVYVAGFWLLGFGAF